MKKNCSFYQDFFFLKKMLTHFYLFFQKSKTTIKNNFQSKKLMSRFWRFKTYFSVVVGKAY